MPKSSCFLWCCANPINFDTYVGCSHRCAYCFANFRTMRGGKFANVEPGEGPQALKNWIDGKRGAREAWAGWNIPICWGRNSDPFQPCEREKRRSLECLKLFAESRYPFVLTTKSTLIAEEPYRSLFARCNCVVQISMVSHLYDPLERGAPPYEERLKCAGEMSKVVPRVIARWQPLYLEMRKELNFNEILKEIPRVKAAGCYAIMAGAIKQPKKFPPYLVERVGRYYEYPVEFIDHAYARIRRECHANGLVFLSGDAQRHSDSLECCGTEGLEGFEPNLCTTTRHFLAPETYAERPCQCQKGTGCAWKNTMPRALADDSFMKDSFAEVQRSRFDREHESLSKIGFFVNDGKGEGGKGGTDDE